MSGKHFNSKKHSRRKHKITDIKTYTTERERIYETDLSQYRKKKAAKVT
jgi:hypothetical protein